MQGFPSSAWLFKFEYKFSPTNYNQDGRQMATTYQFAFVDNLP